MFCFVCLHNSYLFGAVLPDFSQVYNFIGSVFDPDARDHMQKLKKMDPLDVQTVCVSVIIWMKLLVNIIIFGNDIAV